MARYKFYIVLYCIVLYCIVCIAGGSLQCRHHVCFVLRVLGGAWCSNTVDICPHSRCCLSSSRCIDSA